MYAIKCYGAGLMFPLFMDNLKNRRIVDYYVQQGKSDGFHTIEVLKENPTKPGYFGVTRTLVQTLNFTV